MCLEHTINPSVIEQGQLPASDDKWSSCYSCLSGCPCFSMQPPTMLTLLHWFPSNPGRDSQWPLKFSNSLKEALSVAVSPYPKGVTWDFTRISLVYRTGTAGVNFSWNQSFSPADQMLLPNWILKTGDILYSILSSPKYIGKVWRCFWFWLWG